MFEVGSEERASLGVVRIARGVKHVWGGAVVVGRPLGSGSQYRRWETNLVVVRGILFDFDLVQAKDIAIL